MDKVRKEMERKFGRSWRSEAMQWYRSYIVVRKRLDYCLTQNGRLRKALYRALR